MGRLLLAGRMTVHSLRVVIRILQSRERVLHCIWINEKNVLVTYYLQITFSFSKAIANLQYYTAVLVVWNISSSVIRLNASETVSSNCGRKTAAKKSSKNEVTVDATNELLYPISSESVAEVRYQLFDSVQERDGWGEKINDIERIWCNQKFMAGDCTVHLASNTDDWWVGFCAFSLKD